MARYASDEVPTNELILNPIIPAPVKFAVLVTNKIEVVAFIKYAPNHLRETVPTLPVISTAGNKLLEESTPTRTPALEII